MVDKICQNCENYKCNRTVKKGFLGVSVDCRYDKDNVCMKTKHNIASGGCHCNCNRFEVWGKLQIELDKEKAKKEQKKIEEIQKREQYRAMNIASQSHTATNNYSSKDYESTKQSIAKMTNANTEFLAAANSSKEVDKLKKYISIPIIFTVLGILSIIGGIASCVIASMYVNSYSKPPKEVIENAQSTNTMGIVFIIVGISITVISWLI